MKQERILEALNDIGDDLLDMAQNRRFVNHWKRWGRTAACLALVICLTALALPYFPVGCGSSTETAAPEAAPEAPAAVEKQEIPMEEAPAEECMPEAEEAPAADVTEVITVWMGGIGYEIQPGVREVPEDLGKELGMVEKSDGRPLDGCKVFAALESGGIYVEVPEGYLLGLEID